MDDDLSLEEGKKESVDSSSGCAHDKDTTISSSTYYRREEDTGKSDESKQRLENNKIA